MPRLHPARRLGLQALRLILLLALLHFGLRLLSAAVALSSGPVLLNSQLIAGLLLILGLTIALALALRALNHHLRRPPCNPTSGL